MPGGHASSSPPAAGVARDRDQARGETRLGPIFARLRERYAPAPAALVAVGGRHDDNGWKLLLLAGGEVLGALEVAAARQLAGEILATCDVLDGGAW